MRRRGGGIIDEMEDVDLMSEETGFQASPSRKKYTVKNPMEDIESKSSQNIEQKETYSFANGGYFQRRFNKQHTTKNASESSQSTPRRHRHRETSFSSETKESSSKLPSSDKKRVRSNETLVSTITTQSTNASPIVNQNNESRNNQNLDSNNTEYNDNDDEDVDADVEDDEYDDDLQKLVKEKKENEKKKHKNKEKNRNKNRSQNFLLNGEKPPFSSANGVFKKQDQEFLEGLKKKQEENNQKQQQLDTAKTNLVKEEVKEEKNKSPPTLRGSPSEFSLEEKDTEQSDVQSGSNRYPINDGTKTLQPRRDFPKPKINNPLQTAPPDNSYTQLNSIPQTTANKYNTVPNNSENNSAEIVAQSRLRSISNAAALGPPAAALYKAQRQSLSIPTLSNFKENSNAENASPLLSTSEAAVTNNSTGNSVPPLPNSMYPTRPKQQQVTNKITTTESDNNAPTTNVKQRFDEERKQLFGEKLFEKAQKEERERKEKEKEEEKMKHKYGEAPEVLAFPAPSKAYRRNHGYIAPIKPQNENEEKIPITSYSIDALFASASYSISESFMPRKPELNVQKLNEDISRHYKTTITGINDFSQKAQNLQMSLSNTVDEFARVSTDANNISDKVEDIHKKTQELIENGTHFPSFKETTLELAINFFVKFVTLFIWIYCLIRNIYLYIFGQPVSVDYQDVYSYVKQKKKWIESMKNIEKSISIDEENS